MTFVIKNNKVGINVKEPGDTLEIGGNMTRNKIHLKIPAVRIQNVNNRLLFFDSISSNGVYISDLEYVITAVMDNDYGRALTKISYNDEDDLVKFDNCGNGVIFMDKIMLGNKDNIIRYDTLTNSFAFSNTNHPDFMYIRPEAFNIPRGPESQRPYTSRR